MAPVPGTSATTDISGTSGDVIGSAISGTGNIIGKEVAYSVSGSVINLHVDSMTTQTLQEFKNIMTQSTKEETKQVLKDIDQIGKEKGISIEQIRVGAVQISRTELTSRDIVREGNEHIYKSEYSKAIEYYDKALEIDKKSAFAWGMKGMALFVTPGGTKKL